MAESQLHVAIIMDGNGRWAQRRGRPRLEGHKQGGKVVSELVKAAINMPLQTLTLYCFSEDNWKRPMAEVRGLFRLLHRFLGRHGAELIKKGVRFKVIGRRDRLPCF